MPLMARVVCTDNHLMLALQCWFLAAPFVNAKLSEPQQQNKHYAFHAAIPVHF